MSLGFAVKYGSGSDVVLGVADGLAPALIDGCGVGLALGELVAVPVGLGATRGLELGSGLGMGAEDAAKSMKRIGTIAEEFSPTTPSKVTTKENVAPLLLTRGTKSLGRLGTFPAVVVWVDTLTRPCTIGNVANSVTDVCHQILGCTHGAQPSAASSGSRQCRLTTRMEAASPDVAESKKVSPGAKAVPGPELANRTAGMPTLTSGDPGSSATTSTPVVPIQDGGCGVGDVVGTAVEDGVPEAVGAAEFDGVGAGDTSSVADLDGDGLGLRDGDGLGVRDGERVGDAVCVGVPSGLAAALGDASGLGAAIPNRVAHSQDTPVMASEKEHRPAPATSAISTRPSWELPSGIASDS